MDAVGSGDIIKEDENARTRIVLGDDPHLLAQLRAKLAEYHERERNGPDMTYTHPEYQAFQQGAGMFKAKILAYVLGLAEERDTQVLPIELVEVAEAFEALYGYDLTAVKKAPIIFDSRYGVHCHNQTELLAQGGELGLAFSSAYWIIRSYTNGEMGGTGGGTGLPEVDVS